MTITPECVRVFYEQGERQGWKQFFRERQGALLKNLTEAKPDDAKEIHRIQSELRLFRDGFPRVIEEIDKYAAQRAAASQSAGA